MNSTRTCRCACLAAIVAWATAAAAQPAEGAAAVATTQEPRAFGYTVGDIVQRRVRLQLPEGLAPDLSSLPQARRPGQALELRSALWKGSELWLSYQVFHAPTEVQTLEIAPLKLRLAGPAGERLVRIEAWPITVAPLAPLEPSPREGLGELRPDTAPPLIDTSARRARGAAYAAALALLALFFLERRFGLPWRRRRQRPFARAWPALKALPAAPSASERQAAFRQLHAALNACAGEALFEPGLTRFIARHPAFAHLQAELALFFQRSREELFAGQASATDGAWLKRLARACRDAERAEP